MGRVESLNEPGRSYVFDELAISTFHKKYRYFDEGEKLLRMSRGDIAGISDIFCILPICIFIVCDKQAIRRFLQAEKSRNKELLIAGVEDEIGLEQDYLGSRLSQLYKCGFLMEMQYFPRPYQPCTLYSVPKDTADLVTKKLDIRLVPEKWSAETALYRIFGRAAAANVASYLAGHKNYRGLEKCVCNFSKSNVTLLPEFTFQNSIGVEYIVGIYYGFLRHDERIQSREQYESSVLRRVSFLEEYVTYRNPKKSSNLVLVVEDEADLKFLCRAMLALDYFDTEKLEKIYFTGEGIFLAAGEEGRKRLTGLFLRIRPDGLLEENVTPEFLI